MISNDLLSWNYNLSSLHLSPPAKVNSLLVSPGDVLQYHSYKHLQLYTLYITKYMFPNPRKVETSWEFEKVFGEEQRNNERLIIDY